MAFVPQNTMVSGDLKSAWQVYIQDKLDTTGMVLSKLPLSQPFTPRNLLKHDSALRDSSDLDWPQVHVAMS